MHAHQDVTALPIDLHGHRRPDSEARRAVGGDVNDVLAAVTLDRIDDLDGGAVVGDQGADIAGLAAAAGVEDGRIALDATVIDRRSSLNGSALTALPHPVVRSAPPRDVRGIGQGARRFHGMRERGPRWDRLALRARCDARTMLHIARRAAPSRKANLSHQSVSVKR